MNQYSCKLITDRVSGQCTVIGRVRPSICVFCVFTLVCESTDLTLIFAYLWVGFCLRTI